MTLPSHSKKKIPRSNNSPTNPDYVNWKLHFPKFFGGTDEENQKIYVNSTVGLSHS